MYLHQELTHKIFDGPALEDLNGEFLSQQNHHAPKRSEREFAPKWSYAIPSKALFYNFLVESWQDLFAAMGPGFRGAKLVIDTC